MEKVLTDYITNAWFFVNTFLNIGSIYIFITIMSTVIIAFSFKFTIMKVYFLKLKY